MKLLRLINAAILVVFAGTALFGQTLTETWKTDRFANDVNKWTLYWHVSFSDTDSLTSINSPVFSVDQAFWQEDSVVFTGYVGSGTDSGGSNDVYALLFGRMNRAGYQTAWDTCAIVADSAGSDGYVHFGTAVYNESGSVYRYDEFRLHIDPTSQNRANSWFKVTLDAVRQRWESP